MLFGLSVSFMMKIIVYNYNGMNKERKKENILNLVFFMKVLKDLYNFCRLRFGDNFWWFWFVFCYLV